MDLANLLTLYISKIIQIKNYTVMISFICGKETKLINKQNKLLDDKNQTMTIRNERNWIELGQRGQLYSETW